jgi:hypothetical protein
MIAQAAASTFLGAPALPALSMGQRLADQVFQALARGTNTAVVSSLLLSPAPVDTLDSLNLDEGSARLETSLETRGASPTRPRPATSEAPAQQPQEDLAALDHVFAQVTDDADLLMADE